ncbi:hypothetical protein EW146_g4885 [Bondarzewia mesenterica]|uniref:Uncharacterized protein n=1 Tax=Bondarzewia mesenterica TaxID=1095465 RepID=A0A4S4LV95_9AGAM|nr:hypothetical protein EW146_g4885 [Bondarzewia mesenterica]
MSQSLPTSATQAKERQYAQLANSLTRLSRSVGHTADLFEQLQVDLDSMRTLAALHAAQFIAVASELNPDTGKKAQER